MRWLLRFNRRLRSDAEEILEGLLLHAANAYQERKLRHLGAILPSLAVRPEISPADGHWLTLLTDRLTWRQLVVLSVFHDPPTDRFSARDIDRDEGAARGPAGSIRDEIEELGTFGLLGVTNSNGDIVHASGTMGTMATIWGAPVGSWKLTAQGRLLAEVARLDTVPTADQGWVRAELLL